ncbi:hypothetical protein B9Z65_7392 [Elsinoe australis]|uniref:Structural maintenance of chromosomes protein 5 n=1 Tax=Elsinoe australis TaxID=40998 RepID=A0A2P7YC20_9PEZI|nr:hypothetical protein B9Z65_7392 [Elsinoe australis]
MPGLVNGRKRSLSPVSDEEDNESLQSQELGSSSKRARTNGYHSESPSRPLLPSSYRADSLTGQNGSTPQLVHQPGSIYRVTMRNFVTYKEAEFLPGPSLNMIIGPNGTGKSTLVCAICLGLGWKTEHLGRAKEVGEFVRHGCSSAEIEIELTRDPQRHEENPVIKMVIRKSDNKSNFFLNGRAVSRRRVMEECRSFAIQVDNLCQFLPQDRVVEFAALNPVDLLAQTLRAAAPEEMTDQHDELKRLHNDQAKLLLDQKTHADNLKTMESRHNAQRTDVERVQERAAIQERVNALELYKPKLEYNAAKAKWEEAKSRKLTAQRELQNLEAQVAPALESVEEKRKYVEDVRTAVKKREKLVQRSEQNATVQFEKQNEIEKNIEAAEAEINSEDKRQKDLYQNRARIRKQISDLELKMQNTPPAFEPASYNERLREFTRQIRDLDEKIELARQQNSDCANQIRQRENRIQNLERDMSNLRSQAGRQENKLKRQSPETFKAWRWVQENKTLFKGPVFGPPMLICSVREPRHADAVESVLGPSEMQAFTVTNDQDFQTLQRSLLGQQHMSDIYIRSSKFPLSHYRTPIPREELAALGLEGYVVDLLEGPDEVLGMLCDTSRLHATAVAGPPITAEQIDNIQNTAINQFITASEVYTTTRRREYGAAGTSTRTRRTKKASIFTDSAVDTGAENEIKTQILEAKGEIAELREQQKQHKETVESAGKQRTDTQEQKNDTEQQKNALQTAVATFNALPSKLSAEKDKLEANEDNIKNGRQAIQDIKDRKSRETLKKGKESTLFAVSIMSLQKSHTELFEAEITLIEAESDLETLETKNIEVRNMLDQRKMELETLKDELRTLREEAQAALERVNEANMRLTERDVEIQEEQPRDQTVEGLQNDIEGLQARLEMVHEGNSNVMKEFEERTIRIEKTKEKLERISRELETLERQIGEIRGEWEPMVDTLLAQISDAFGDNFARIGCAGQVEVLKTEDFSEWSISIQVKFREHEQLSILDSHRQSGGERAVSTIFYLMALQSLARAPFRVVDEINQGMDPRNERLVHARMVNIACAEHTSQYFLITPKLLPNLKYDPRMKIHCIASGEYMPEDHKQLDFQSLAVKALGVQRRISGVV